jgi:hypothetical protein
MKERWNDKTQYIRVYNIVINNAEYRMVMKKTDKMNLSFILWY